MGRWNEETRMLSSRKWNDGRHWRRFAALFSCSFLIICFLIHKAKGESSMLLKPEIEQNGTSIEGVLYTPNGEGPFPTVILTHGFTGNYTYITGNIAKELAKAGFAAYAFNLRNPDTRSMLNTSVLTEAATLDTVIDQIKALIRLRRRPARGHSGAGSVLPGVRAAG